MMYAQPNFAPSDINHQDPRIAPTEEHGGVNDSQGIFHKRRIDQYIARWGVEISDSWGE